MSRTAFGRAGGALLVLAAVGAGCNPSPGDNLPFVVKGHVTQSPTANCPMTRPEECTPAPVAGARVRLFLGDKLLEDTATRADGSYSLAQYAGTYTVVVVPATGPYPRCEPFELVVTRSATRDISCDSGIRTAG
jgi:hypothetical protein